MMNKIPPLTKKYFILPYLFIICDGSEKNILDHDHDAYAHITICFRNMVVKRKILVPLLWTMILTISSPLHSEDPADVMRKGAQFSDKKMYPEAVKEFQRAIDLYNASSAKAYHNMGYAMELKGDYTGAIKHYEEAVRRNPVQIPSFERVGFLYFKTGEYEKAVSAGEYVLKTDPKNAEVVKWLPEAIKMKLIKQQDMMLANQEEEALKKKADKELKEQERVLYISFDGLIRTGYYYDGGEYKYIKTPGLYADFPHMLYVDVTPTQGWEFDLKTGNPYLGALTPPLIVHSETLQAMYHLGNYYLGLGVMGNHYKNDINFGKEYTLNDYKGGVLFGVAQDKYVFDITLYPRFLPYDSEHNSGKTMDASYIEFAYRYTVDKFLSYYSKISAADYIFFDHEQELSNYWGVYEIGFGVSLGMFGKSSSRKNFALTLEFIERLYMQDLNNDDPYSFGNGQGWFGMNTEEWFKGDPFSGYYTSGHVFSVRVDEYAADHIFLYQKLSFELTGGEGDHNELNLLLGVGGIY